MEVRTLIYILFATWLLTIPGCNVIRGDLQINDHTQYCVEAGKHKFKPEQGEIRRINSINEIRWSVWFDSTAIYELKNSNQKDWNKGGGVSFDLFSNHKNSIRWAWRYVPDSLFFQLNLYAYVDEIRVTGTGDLPSVEVLERFDIVLYPTNNQRWCMLFFPDTEQEKSIDVVFHDSVGAMARYTGLYFGGDEAATHKMYVYLKTVII